MPDEIQQVYVIRHGETEWSLSGRHTGTTDIPLTDTGRKKAKLLQPVLASQSYALVLTSPLQRARVTFELAGLAAEAEVTPDLLEWNYGAYEGLTSSQIEEKRPGWVLFSDGCPAGESPEQVGARADRIVARARGARGNVALFSHGHFLRVLAVRWLGLPVSAGRHLLLDTGTLNVLSYYRHIPAIKTWNALIV